MEEVAHQRSEEEASDTSDAGELEPLNRPEAEQPNAGADALNGVSKPSEKGAQPTKQRTKSAWRRWLTPSRFCCFLSALFLVTVLLLLSAGGLWAYKAGTPLYGESDSWYPSPQGGTVEAWRQSYERAAALVSQMTLVEKVNITTGTGWSMGMCVGNTGPVDRLDFPSLCLQDGPLGLRFMDNATAFPAGITVGATWNKDLMYERGRAHGFEARLKGINVILGPAMGPFGRLPAGGRNWEGFGADPVLQGIAAARTIQGIQAEGVIATAKHYVANEQEHFRQSWEWGTPNAISSNIDDRTMHEIYAWPFAESVRAGVASVMCSYNQINNSYACQNSKLLNGVLKDELGFQGFVQSDWLAQRSGVAAALAGLDMTMPGDGLFWQDGQSLWGSELTKAVLNSSVPMDRLNDMVMRIVAAWYQLGQDDVEQWPKPSEGGGPNFSSWTKERIGKLHPGSPDSKETGVVNQYVPVRRTAEGGDHDDLARKIAREGIVLVKNEDKVLPLSRNASGHPSLTRDEKLRVGIFGEDAFNNPRGINACPDRGCNEGTLSQGWGSGAVELPYLISPAEALRGRFDSQFVDLTYWPTNVVQHVDGTASAQELCLVFVNSDAGEGFISWKDVKGDRNDLYPQKGGDELVQAVAAGCGGKNESGYPVGDTIVVVHTVGPTILERWIDMPGVKAVLIAHLPGQESGNALADVLFGDHNPSGRLPYTIARKEEHYGPSSKILRVANGLAPQQNFTEGIYIDYRYFDKHNITPRYEFGYGLSYSSFKLGGLFVHPVGSWTQEPKRREASPVSPPQLDRHIPDPEQALWPEGMQRLRKYVYPYISTAAEVKQGRYPYPEGYSHIQEPSPAGGGEGGNPSLYETLVSIQARVNNMGPVAGDAVVQLYVLYDPDTVGYGNKALDLPVRVLRDWTKIYLEAGKTEGVRFGLTRKDISYWDVERQNWVVPRGRITVCLGFSSRDLPPTACSTLPHVVAEPNP
ncbi:glycoside hydrolase family 3 protein [Baudoinia panamericana UAMH 10762]|uniref:Probable beta-glucosidase E n=1 Tax=Baudoinia panamericana (strain UAMH 10762) TaxID=717646 RepID=M2N6X9_BAUPA|nr:glycoside hydrolase family 3 protein [Baudoinia panamericana UAMH 10762]EMC94844.1 glycoside hydrolase family 3 protein [Baudoinia panamericana UAMH 10762]